MGKRYELPDKQFLVCVEAFGFVVSPAKLFEERSINPHCPGKRMIPIIICPRVGQIALQGQQGIAKGVDKIWRQRLPRSVDIRSGRERVQEPQSFMLFKRKPALARDACRVFVL